MVILFSGKMYVLWIKYIFIFFLSMVEILTAICYNVSGELWTQKHT